jgi:phosphoenolpyruvate synthase/pyruvate phosphate dikinase
MALVWLEGVVDPTEVGPRATALATLRAESVPTPRAFALGRTLYARFQQYMLNARDSSPIVGGKLPPDVVQAILNALKDLDGAWAIRRSSLDGDAAAEFPTGGRPERETFLHLVDGSEVIEAVRRIWGASLVAAQPVTHAIVVQRFIQPEASALVRRGPELDTIVVQSSPGVGDLLAAGLVVPDRHVLRVSDGEILSSTLGRKAQMSVPRQDGGLIRVPVPVRSTRRMTLEAQMLGEIASLWRRAETHCGSLAWMSAAIAAGRAWVTTAVPQLEVDVSSAATGS